MAEEPHDMTSVFQDNAKTFASMRAEAEFERKAEAHFRGQRELPNGRNFRWEHFRFDTGKDRESYRANYDRIFPDAPGAGM